MPTWSDVDALAGRLPDAERGLAHEGSPAWYAGRHMFARYREDDGRQVVQLWSGDMDLERQLAPRSETFVRSTPSSSASRCGPRSTASTRGSWRSCCSTPTRSGAAYVVRGG